MAARSALMRGWRYLAHYRARLLLGLCGALYLFMFGYAITVGLYHPYRNWDHIPYVASAITLEESDSGRVHEKTLREVRRTAHGYYREFSDAGSLFGDAERMEQLLPFYTVKPLYVSGIWMLEKLKIMPYAEATWAISTMSFGLLGLLLALWRPRNLPYAIWLLALMFLLFIGRGAPLTMARVSSPDALCTLFMMAMMYFILQRRNAAGFILCGWLAILARPDALILFLAACLCIWLANDRKSRLSNPEALIAVGGGVLLYLLVQVWAGSYGWETLFVYTFIYKTPYPAQMDPNLTVSRYFTILGTGLSKITSDVRLLPMLALSAMAIFCQYMYPAARRIWAWVLAMAWFSYTLRFLLYPAWWEYRYFYIHYLLVLAAAAEMIPPYLGILWGRLQRHRSALRVGIRE